MGKIHKYRYLFAMAFLILFSISIYSIYVYQDLDKNGVVVLLYHKILMDNNINNKYEIKYDKFIFHLNYMRKEGYITILPKDIPNVLIGERKYVILTFDDGTIDHYNIVYDTLKKRNISGVFFVITKAIGRDGYMNEAQIKEMHLGGMEIGSHSYSHPFLDQMPLEDIQKQLLTSKNNLEKTIGENVLSFAPPGGWFNKNVLKLSKEVGYQYFFSCKIGVNSAGNVKDVIRRNEIYGDMSNEDFKAMLNPKNAFIKKIFQNLKFIVHDLIGSRYYHNLAELI